MVVRAIFGVISTVVGILTMIGGWWWVYYPWIDLEEEGRHSVSYFHDMCQNSLWTLVASEECSTFNSWYSLGNGAIFIGLIVTIFGLLMILIPSRAKSAPPTVFTGNTESKWGSKCPNCGAINFGNPDFLKGQIHCGNCNAPFVASSIENFH